MNVRTNSGKTLFLRLLPGTVAAKGGTLSVAKT